MRLFAASFAALSSGVLLSACSPLDRTFLDAGVGTDLYASATSGSPDLEDLYVGLLCDRAGISCGDLALGSPSWTVIVQAGMNDIDQRCDAYLTWLDDRSRSQAPILKELSDLSVATQAIMATTPAGVGAITAVGIAFGLASSTFTNFNSRLLYEINHSTVQSIVLGNDNRFRQDLNGKIINNRPAAIYALRSYLRLCMPFTIETQINNAVTLFEVGGIASAGVNPNPLISANNVATVSTTIKGLATDDTVQILMNCLKTKDKAQIAALESLSVRKLNGHLFTLVNDPNKRAERLQLITACRGT
jgi:hypothetical protein